MNLIMLQLMSQAKEIEDLKISEIVWVANQAYQIFSK